MPCWRSISCRRFLSALRFVRSSEVVRLPPTPRSWPCPASAATATAAPRGGLAGLSSWRWTRAAFARGRKVIALEEIFAPVASPLRPRTWGGGRGLKSVVIWSLSRYGRPSQWWSTSWVPRGVVKMYSDPDLPSHHLSTNHSCGNRLMFSQPSVFCKTLLEFPFSPLLIRSLRRCHQPVVEIP